MEAMTQPEWAFDFVLALALPALAWRVTTRANLREGVVLFVAFGLLMALAWGRLNAPDIALVEAAMGTGLTGTLLMSCIAWHDALQRALPEPRQRGRVVPIALALGGLMLVLRGTFDALMPARAGLARQVGDAMERSGVGHAVTAVLLNFRSLDTLFEVIVLVVAAVGVQRIGNAGSGSAAEPRETPLDAPPLDALIHLLTPGFVLVAGYLVWQGSHAPGGAFQAAAVLAGGGVPLLLAKRMRAPSFSRWNMRAAVLTGPALFLIAAAAPLASGDSLLEYPQRWAGTIILMLEATLTVSIALMLLCFVPASLGSSSLDRSAGPRGRR